LAGVVVLGALSLGIGLGLNHFRARPLPLVYQSPKERFEAELTKVIHAPPFQVTQLQTIGLGEFRHLVQDHSALILDARASVFYREGHVPGALNLSRDNFARDYERLSLVLKAARDKPIVAYCSGGDCHDSKLVASALVSLGFTQVQVFHGGWEEWTKAGLPQAR
jgi:rhodanese-related sulfurtransferase